jgi:hypothetical protein
VLERVERLRLLAQWLALPRFVEVAAAARADRILRFLQTFRATPVASPVHM